MPVWHICRSRDFAAPQRRGVGLESLARQLLCAVRRANRSKPVRLTGRSPDPKALVVEEGFLS